VRLGLCLNRAPIRLRIINCLEFMEMRLLRLLSIPGPCTPNNDHRRAIRNNRPGILVRVTLLHSNRVRGKFRPGTTHQATFHLSHARMLPIRIKNSSGKVSNLHSNPNGVPVDRNSRAIHRRIVRLTQIDLISILRAVQINMAHPHKHISSSKEDHQAMLNLILGRTLV
jgi:hypothetical protein